MLRLSLLLCAVMLAALFIAGEDRGQMRPGLAKATAEGTLVVVEAEPEPQEPTPMVVVEAVAEAPVEIAEATPAPAEPVATPYVEPIREVVQVVEEPIFTLSAVGNELVPGEAEAAFPVPDATEAVATGADGAVWYVTADSVNVRAEPSTEAEILGKLGTGEATLMVAAINDEWARIRIEGDGMEGYVAIRYLAPEAP
jgi:uncharacterized protein YgiM (DUF1202 family)